MDYAIQGAQQNNAAAYAGIAPPKAPLQPRINETVDSLRMTRDLLMSLDARLFGAKPEANAALTPIDTSVDDLATTALNEARRLHSIALAILDRI